MQNHSSTIQHPLMISDLRAWLSVLLALLCLLALFSCKETEKTEVAVISPLSKIKTITFYRNEAVQTIQSFEYDSLGRCTKLSDYDPETATTTHSSYQYAPHMVLVNRVYDELNQYYSRDTIFLNEQGLEIRTSHHSDNREYDSSGYLIQRKEFGLTAMPVTYSFQVLDGNTVKTIQTINDPTEDRIFYTMYFTFIPNSVNTIGVENKGLYFHGKQDKNLVKEYHTDIVYRDPADYTDSYLYEYDAKKRVTKRISKNNAVRIYEAYTYYE